MEEKPTITNTIKKFTSKERTEESIRELIEYEKIQFCIQKLNELDSILETKVGYLNSLIEECKGKMRNTGLKYKKSGIKIAKEDIRRQLKDLKEQL